MTLYESLAQRIIDDIISLRLPAGSKLPALRVMARQNNISINTATHTYHYLQQTGWIYAQPQSGYFVASRMQGAQFPTVAELPLQSRDPRSFAPATGYNPEVNRFNPLGTSLLAPALLPEVELQRTIKRVVRRANRSLFQYPEPQGDTLLREALAQHFRSEYFAFSQDELVITNSCLDAVRLAVETVTDKGDTIAVCSPCFSGLLDLLAELSRDIVEIPVNQDGINLTTLEACMAKGLISAALLSTSNVNPIGITLPDEQKQAIARLAAHYQIPVIEDDAYLELSHRKRRIQPAKFWDTGGYMLWCSSVSKTLAPGLRLGWCLPGRYLSGYLQRHTKTSLGVNALMQASIAEFVMTGAYRSHLNKTRITLQHQINQYRQFLLRHLPANSRVSIPDGGLVLWIHIPGLDAVKLEYLAREHGVDVRSGACFSTHEIYHDCFRINCGWPFNESDREDSVSTQLITLCQLITDIPESFKKPESSKNELFST